MKRSEKNHLRREIYLRPHVYIQNGRRFAKSTSFGLFFQEIHNNNTLLTLVREKRWEKIYQKNIFPYFRSNLCEHKRTNMATPCSPSHKAFRAAVCHRTPALKKLKHRRTRVWWPMTAIQNNPLNLNFIPIYLGLILLFILFRFLILH